MAAASPSPAAPSFKFQVSSFTLATLAPEIADAQVSRWLVGPGDSVAIDDDLVEVVTDKAAITIPAPIAGTIDRIAAGPGSAVNAHDTMFTLIQDAKW